jgi:hypothetical protein
MCVCEWDRVTDRQTNIINNIGFQRKHRDREHITKNNEDLTQV